MAAIAVDVTLRGDPTSVTYTVTTQGADAVIRGSSVGFSIFGDPPVVYVNRVYDTVAVGFVRWRTGTPDSTGAYYPGPGVFGVNTSDYCVERIKTTVT